MTISKRCICGLLLCFLCFAIMLPCYGDEPKRLERLPLGSVTAQGWLREQLLRSKTGMGGNLDVLEPEMIGKPYVTRAHESKVSPGWSGEISGTYWAGLVQLAFTLNDPELIAKADKWVHDCIALQEEDGYLGSYRATDNRLEDYSAWSANWCYRALLSWYDATGEREVLDAVHRSLLWYVDHWKGDQKTNYVGTTLMEAMIEVWLLTGDNRLGDWCVEYLAWLDKNDFYCHGKAALERPELEFCEDHTVAFAENVKHPALVYLYNGDPTFLAASENGVRQELDKAWQCTGGPASNFEYHAPPASNHETEYCTWSTWNNTFSHLLRLTNQPKYGDLMEFTLFNGAQGARFKDERAIAYNTSPNQFFATMTSSFFGCDSRFEVYAPCVHVACCPAQSVRIHPEYVRAMFLRDESGNIELPLYGPAKAVFTENENEIAIEEDTLYPFDETIKLRITAKAPWTKTLRLKRPQWCEEYELQLDGKPLTVEEEDGWLAIEHSWQNNELTIKFVMKPRIVPIKDAYFTQCPLQTVQCGPLLFALKYEEHLEPHGGTPLTPLPEGWSWFNVTCKESPVFYSFTQETLAHPEQIEKEVGETVYPWDDSPLKLRVPMIRSTQHAWPKMHGLSSQWHTFLPYGNPVTADKGAGVEFVKLVPFGCTILRQTCFTTAREVE